jgi:hypothetical protein
VDFFNSLLVIPCAIYSLLIAGCNNRPRIQVGEYHRKNGEQFEAINLLPNNRYVQKIETRGEVITKEGKWDLSRSGEILTLTPFWVYFDLNTGKSLQNPQNFGEFFLVSFRDGISPFPHKVFYKRE